MYPLIFGSISSYWVFVALGAIVAMVIYRFLSITFKISDEAYLRFGWILGVSVPAGFIFAFLFQALYNFIGGRDEIFIGLTFMGGLLGGIITFYCISIFATKGNVRHQIWNMTCLAPIPITAAHAIGRLGCFFAGCCFGKETDSCIGVLFPGHTHKVIPTQLMESIFLTILCVFLLLIIFKLKKFSLTPLIYLFSYSIFRFVLEFWRGDYRGGAGFFSPSQWQSIIMFLAAVILTVYIFCFKRIPFNSRQEGKLSQFLYSYN